MSRHNLKQRQLVVTDEPFAIQADLKGRPLSSVPRRALALSLDLALLVMLGTPLLLVATLVALHLRTPALAEALGGAMVGRGFEGGELWLPQLLQQVERRRPHALPSRLGEPLARGDLETVKLLLEEQPISIQAQVGSRDPTWFDAAENKLHIHGDVVFGRFASVFSFAALSLVYFTLALRMGAGRTPGKWLCGIRVVRLDGRKLSLWNAFGRAGGYAASLSTLGVGFFESLWDPNRQALHDRVASTVVIRAPRRGS